MKGYAHPIEGTDPVKWCNEDIKQAVNELPPQPPGDLLPEHQEEVEKARASVRTKMTPEAWSEKDRLQRDSIESQVAFKGMVELFVAGKLNNKTEATTIEWAISRLHSVDQIVAMIKEVKSEANKVSSGVKASDDDVAFVEGCFNKVSEDEGVQTVLDKGELTYDEVKALLLKNKKGVSEWAKEAAQTFGFDMKGKTVRQLWEFLNQSQKRIAVAEFK